MIGTVWGIMLAYCESTWLKGVVLICSMVHREASAASFSSRSSASSVLEVSMLEMAPSMATDSTARDMVSSVSVNPADERLWMVNLLIR